MLTCLSSLLFVPQSLNYLRRLEENMSVARITQQNVSTDSGTSLTIPSFEVMSFYAFVYCFVSLPLTSHLPADT